MFVIGRAVHEQIHIGNTISVKVLRIGNKEVTLGVEAPKGVAVSHEKNLAVSECAPGSPSGCNLNVLIVDDTPIHTWLIEKSFNGYGANQTRVARSGAEALAWLGIGTETAPDSAGYDLIVMDLRLPDMPGLELIRRIRSSWDHGLVPIVVMTYHDSDVEVSRCLEAGANAVIPKPETQEGFRQTVFRIADFWSHARRLPAAGAQPTQESLVC